VTSLQQRQQVDQNYDAFQRMLASLLADRRGQYALMRDRDVVEFFDDPGDAYRAGLRRFSDHLFSIQEVDDEPIDLGIFSHAGD